MLIYNGTDASMMSAVNSVNSDTIKDYIFDAISSRVKFDMSTASNMHIADELESFINSVTIEVIIYYPRWRWSKAIGYFSPSTPTKIFINGYKRLTIADYIGVMYHEIVHMCDYFDDKHSYGHGNNSPTGKQNTAPYAIGNIAKSFLDGKPDYNDTGSGELIYYISWWQRILNFFR